MGFSRSASHPCSGSHLPSLYRTAQADALPPPSKPWPSWITPRRPHRWNSWLIDRRCHVSDSPDAALLQSCSRRRSSAGSSAWRRGRRRGPRLLAVGTAHGAVLDRQDPARCRAWAPAANPRLAAQFLPSFKHFPTPAPGAAGLSATCPSVLMCASEAAFRWATESPVAAIDRALCADRACRPSKQRLRFFEHWLRLEATLKAQGPASWRRRSVRQPPPLTSPAALATRGGATGLRCGP